MINSSYTNAAVSETFPVCKDARMAPVICDKKPIAKVNTATPQPFEAIAQQKMMNVAMPIIRKTKPSFV